MNRRQFVRHCAFGAAGALVAAAPKAWGGISGSKIPTPGSSIGYIRNQIPAFEIPPYRGTYYEDQVPDTLDIAERAKLSIHVLTSVTDPAADFQIYWAVDLLRNPPFMQHQFDDYHVQVVEGFLEALPLLRVATGSDLDSQVDRVWMSNFLKCLGPDGMFYLPLIGGPWDRPRPGEDRSVWTPKGTSLSLGDPSVTQITSGQLSARCLGTMTAYYRRDSNPLWKAAAERMVQRLTQLVIREGSYSYLPLGSLEPNGKYGSGAQKPFGLDAIELVGRLSQGLSQYYRASGSETALDLARRLVIYFRDHSATFDKEGRFLWADSDRQSLGWGYSAKYETVGGHAHGRAIGLLSMLEYAAAANDHETAQFVKASFEWAKNQQESPFGVSQLVGWFPEWYYPQYPSCEGCMAADMLALAIKLSVAGLGDYWDEVDRWVRNDYSEQQLTDPDWIHRATEHLAPQAVPPHSVAEDTPQRNVGAFAGWSTGNEWVLHGGIMHCCTGNGSRTMFYVWENILAHSNGELKLNLLLNRASSAADVYSYIPYSGRVDIKVKAPLRRVLLRAPQWVESGSPDVTCEINGNKRVLAWNDRYLSAGSADAGQTLVFRFPIPKRTVTERIGPNKYNLVLKGNTVISIDPNGENGPLYADRERYSSDEVPWRKLRRFVSDESIAW